MDLFGLRWSIESIYPLDTPCAENIIDHTGSWLSTFDAVIFSDYNKGVCSKPIIGAVMEMCKHGNTPVFVDPKFDNFWEYEGATIFKPNMSEFLHCFGQCFSPMKTLNEEIDEARRCLGCPHVVVTNGSDGLYTNNDMQRLHFDGHEVKVVDVCGAGDAVMAVLSLEYLRTGDIFKAAELANWAGALAVQQHGTATITTKDLEVYYETEGEKSTPV